MDLLGLFSDVKEQKLFGRYITNNHIEPILQILPSEFDVVVIGESVLKKTIYSVTIGSGSKKIFLWSQMHGNDNDQSIV